MGLRFSPPSSEAVSHSSGHMRSRVFAIQISKLGCPSFEKAGCRRHKKPGTNVDSKVEAGLPTPLQLRVSDAAHTACLKGKLCHPRRGNRPNQPSCPSVVWIKDKCLTQSVLDSGDIPLSAGLPFIDNLLHRWELTSQRRADLVATHTVLARVPLTQLLGDQPQNRNEPQVHRATNALSPFDPVTRTVHRRFVVEAFSYD